MQSTENSFSYNAENLKIFLKTSRRQSSLHDLGVSLYLASASRPSSTSTAFISEKLESQLQTMAAAILLEKQLNYCSPAVETIMYPSNLISR